jgi:hypothetical protein
MFQTHFLGIFFFSNKRKQKEKEKKKHKKIKCKERRELTFKLSLLPSHFWLPLLASYFCPFVLSTFSFASFSFQVEEKKEKHKEKNAKKKGAYLFSLDSTFGMKCSSCFLLSTFLQC